MISFQVYCSPPRFHSRSTVLLHDFIPGLLFSSTISFRVLPTSFISASAVLLHDPSGQPRFLFPGGAHLSAVRRWLALFNCRIYDPALSNVSLQSSTLLQMSVRLQNFFVGYTGFQVDSEDLRKTTFLETFVPGLDLLTRMEWKRMECFRNCRPLKTHGMVTPRSVIKKKKDSCMPFNPQI